MQVTGEKKKDMYKQIANNVGVSGGGSYARKKSTQS